MGLIVYEFDQSGGNFSRVPVSVATKSDASISA